MKNYYFVVYGIGYLPMKFETRELAEEHAKVAYYQGEKYKVVEGEEAFRSEYEAAWRELDKDEAKKIRNDKLWGRFIKGFNVCHRHCFQD